MSATASAIPPTPMSIPYSYAAAAARGMKKTQHPSPSSSPNMAPRSAPRVTEIVDPDVRRILGQLDKALQMEMKYRGSAQPAQPEPDSAGSGTITSGMRDGSAHVLRCLKVWYDLPSDVFFTAVSSIDRFLAKMKVRRSSLLYGYLHDVIKPL